MRRDVTPRVFPDVARRGRRAGRCRGSERGRGSRAERWSATPDAGELAFCLREAKSRLCELCREKPAVPGR